MAYDWNPNNPSTPMLPRTRLGLEAWFDAQGDTAITDPSRAEMFIAPIASGTHEQLMIFSPNSAADRDHAISTGGKTAVEIFPVGSEVPTGVEETVWLPSSVVASSAVTNANGTAPSLGQIDNWPDVIGGAPSTAQYFSFNATSAVHSPYVDLAFSGAPAIPSNRRILSARVLAVAASAVDTSLRFTADVYSGSGSLIQRLGKIPVQSIPPNWTPQQGDSPIPIERETFHQQTVEIAIPRFMTAADLSNFSVTGASGWRVRIRTETGQGDVRLRLYNIALAITHCEENRLARGVSGLPAINEGGGWSEYPIQTPAGSAWTVSGALQTFTICVRPLRSLGPWSQPSVGRASWRWLRNPSRRNWGLGPQAPFGATSASVNDDGSVGAVGEWDPSRIRPWVTSAGTITPILQDGQPYTDLPGIDLGSKTAFFNLTHGSGTISTRVYTHVILSARAKAPDPRRAHLPHMVSGKVGVVGSLPLSTFTIQRSDLCGDGEWCDVQVPLDTPVDMTTDSPYVIEMEATPGWEFIVNTSRANENGLIATSRPSLRGLTFQGDAAYVSSVPPPTTDLYSDAQIVLVNSAAPPAAPSATPMWEELANLGSCSCDTEVSFVRVEWPAMAPETLYFAGTEVQRRVSGSGDPWETVALFPSLDPEGPHQAVFDDYEMPRGVLVEYRYRTLWSNAEPLDSTWSAPALVTAGEGGEDAAIIITSNVDPSITVAFSDVTAGTQAAPRTYEFLNADEVVFRQLHRRDYQVAFRPPEERGVRFVRDLLVRNCSGSEPTLGIFDSLRCAVKADVPYLSVHEKGGGAYRAAVRLLDGSLHVRDDGVGLARIEVTEVEGVPPCG